MFPQYQWGGYCFSFENEIYGHGAGGREFDSGFCRVNNVTSIDTRESVSFSERKSDVLSGFLFCSKDICFGRINFKARGLRGCKRSALGLLIQ